MGIKEKKERKPRKARDIESEYPKWPWVDYKFQDAKFFKEVRKLPTKGLESNGEIIDKYLTPADVAQIFGNVQNHKSLVDRGTKKAVGKPLFEDLWH
jgi:hypothetical protein